MKSIRAVLKREYSYLRKRPYLGSLELTYRCNCRCSTCNVWRLPKQEEELNLREITSVIDQMKDLGIKRILLMGAEPFMRDDILSVIKCIKDKNLECCVTTNAAIINAELANEICAYKTDNLIVSIDKANEGHDLIRSHSGAFNKAISAINYLKQAKKKMASERPSISIHVTLSNLNVDEIEGMWRLKESTGVDSIGYSYACQTREKDFLNTSYNNKPIASSRVLFKDRDITFNNADVASLKNSIKRMQQKKIRLPFSLRSLACWGDVNLSEAIVPIRKCYATSNVVVVDPYGNVLPCPNLDGFKYGSIRKEKLSNILNGTNRNNFLKRISNKFFPACKSCTNFSLTPLQLFRVLASMDLKDKGNFA